MRTHVWYLPDEHDDSVVTEAYRVTNPDADIPEPDEP